MVKILKTVKFETRSACDKRFRVELNAVEPAGRNKNDQMAKQKSDAFQDQMGKLDVPTFGQKEVGRANWEYQEQRPRSSRVWQWIRRGMAIFANGKESWEENFKRIAAPARPSCRTKRRDAKEDDPESWQTTAKGDGVDQTPMWL